MNQQKLLDSVVGDKGERSQRTRLGVALGKAVDRIIHGFRLEQAGDDHKGRRQYRLSRVPTPPVVAAPAPVGAEEVGQWEA